MRVDFGHNGRHSRAGGSLVKAVANVAKLPVDFIATFKSGKSEKSAKRFMDFFKGRNALKIIEKKRPRLKVFLTNITILK